MGLGWRIAVAVGILLLAGMFVVIARHARRKQAADRERQLLNEQNARLQAAQRRFLQDAPRHLRAPLASALTHAELLARDLTGRERDDIQTVADQIIRLRRLVIPAAGVPVRAEGLVSSALPGQDADAEADQDNDLDDLGGHLGQVRP